jgi:CxxC motif-containing protein (DUF1111 family)
MPRRENVMVKAAEVFGVSVFLSGAVLGAVGCGGPPEGPDVEVARSELLGDPLPGLTAAQKARFLTALATFNEVETLDDGLGPVFNEKACGNCHNIGGPGGSGTQFEVRAGKLTGTTFDPLTASGGSLFDRSSVVSLGDPRIMSCAIPPGTGEPVPAAANVSTLRRTTALFGLGLVDATPDQTFKNLAASEPFNIRGRAPLVQNISAGKTTVGKFGWKDQNPTLFQFAGDAYVNEMGITNPQFLTEQPPRGDASLVANCDIKPEPEDDGTDVAQFTDFMRFLAPPDRGPTTIKSALGDVLFTSIGCAGCHVRSITSGSSDVAALSNQTYHPFSDFLLHDMGSLGDNIGGNGDAGIHEMRTAPLWGLRFVDPTNLLHDGSATSLSDAILKHDGQAALSRNLFALLPQISKDNLLAFLNTL